jgi:hypothetical protein
MNLYTVAIRNTVIGRETYHVSAKDARTALDKAYAKCWQANKLKTYPRNEQDMTVTSLALVQENWI